MSEGTPPEPDPALTRLDRFVGRWSGGWRPNPGADETVNVLPDPSSWPAPTECCTELVQPIAPAGASEP